MGKERIMAHDPVVTQIVDAIERSVMDPPKQEDPFIAAFKAANPRWRLTNRSELERRVWNMRHQMQIQANSP
jgi:hypothetical protein